MNFIHGGRASGKTVLLLKQSANTGVPILTTDYIKKRLLMDYAKHMELEIPEPLIWTNHHLPVQIGSKVLIDNGEEVLNTILYTNSGVVCETMVLSDPVKHLTGSFIEGLKDVLKDYPPETLKGRLDCVDALRYGLWAMKSLPTAEELIDALDSLVWYNGAYDDLVKVKKYVKTYDAPGVIHFPIHIFKDRENDNYTPRVIWFLMVCMFGSYGTSPRSGWIDRKNRERAISFLDAVLKTYRDSDEYVEE